MRVVLVPFMDNNNPCDLNLLCEKAFGGRTLKAESFHLSSHHALMASWTFLIYLLGYLGIPFYVSLRYHCESFIIFRLPASVAEARAERPFQFSCRFKVRLATRRLEDVVCLLFRWECLFIHSLLSELLWVDYPWIIRKFSSVHRARVQYS